MEMSQLLEKLYTAQDGLTEAHAYQQQQTHGLNEVAQEKPLTWWQHVWYCYRNPFNVLLSLLALVAF